MSKTYDMYVISIIAIMISFIFLGLSRFSYKYRAFRNKRAWEGMTKPFLIIGMVLLIIGLILFYVFYPY